jgi:hypothetical protein
MRVDLFDVFRSCFRRWYILLPPLLITGWYTHSVYESVKPVYYSQAIVGLAPPSYRLDQAVAGQPVPRNGLLDVGGAALLANMTALALREPAVVNLVVARGGLPDYGAKLFPVAPNAQPIPLVMLEESAPDSAAATKTLSLVTDEASAALERIQRQAKVPPEMMVDSFVVSPASDPIAAMPTRTRSVATIAVAGIGLSVLVAVLTDVFIVRRRNRIELRRHASSQETPPVVDPESQPISDPGSGESESAQDVREPRRSDAADAR